MECYCEPMEADGYSDVWSITHPVARKPHKCCECREPILPGERYERIFSVYDGRVETYKTCTFCEAEFNRLRDTYTDMHLVKGDLACVLVWELRNAPLAAGGE